MHISILTLFPEMFQGPFDFSIIKRAVGKNLLKIDLINIRAFSSDRHKTVDDHPYGGGAGMVLKVDVLDRALQSSLRNEVKPETRLNLVKTRRRSARKTRIVLLDPQGKTFTQKKAWQLAKLNELILICGHYEGIDERIRKLVDEEISIGDYILTGGEIPAMVVVDAITRLIPGVLTKKEATQFESFSPLAPHPSPHATLEHPQYTRPPVYRNWKVPKILLSGDHQKISEWRQNEALKRTKKRRPDLVPIQKD
ncbi:tRNA (guanosine(37)-N1)-methyltransferase TrmD [Candidatus Microgenomates bacterium]|nr:tRNA (guanosine(37)-N1)-methyltransferase TrmD [Candidatus Microgenomates bacterium]